MELKTVGDFKKAKLEFVKGDKRASCIEGVLKPVLLSAALAKATNKTKDIDVLSRSVTEFAWRKNTGVKPEFKGMIECELRNGVVTILISAKCDWTINEDKPASADIIKWRPHLPAVETETQLAKGLDEALHGTDEQKEDLRRYKAGIKTETPEEKEAFDKMKGGTIDPKKAYQDLDHATKEQERVVESVIIKMKLSDWGAVADDLSEVARFLEQSKLRLEGETVPQCIIRELSEKHDIDTRTDKEKCIDNAHELLEEDRVHIPKRLLSVMYDKGLLKC